MISGEAVLTGSLGLAACYTDLRWREIPNWIPVTALAGGAGYLCWQQGWTGLGSSLLGALVGFGVFLLFWLFAGRGGGDVKLMAGFGAVLGAKDVLMAILLTSMVGGLIALGCLAAWRFRFEDEQGRRRTIPYAPAIALGVWLALLARP